MNKRRREDDEEKPFANGLDKTLNESDSRYRVYLIKKPVEISLDELHALKWSGNEEVLAKPKLKTDSGTYRTVVSSKLKKRKMVHVPAIREITKEDSKNIRASSAVDGMVQILPKEIKTKYLGGSIYEENEEPAEDAIIHPLLKKIKKTAELDLSTRTERNKSYGVKK